MFRFDLTSIAAAMSFFICVFLFLKDFLSFIDFCHLLLMLEGIIFLSGALSNSHTNNKPLIELEETKTDSSIQFNRTRYVIGLIFFFAGSFTSYFQ